METIAIIILIALILGDFDFSVQDSGMHELDSRGSNWYDCIAQMQ